MIQAAITALKIVRKAVDPEITKTVIVSNNKDMVMSITEWVFTWKKDGWDKIPEVLSEYRAKNRDLLEKLDGLVDEMLDEGLEVQFLYVKYGHRDTSYGQSVLAREGCVK